MTLEEYKKKIIDSYGSISKFCDANESKLKEAGISRATFYNLLNNTIKNPTRDNLVAFAKLSEIPLEEIASTFIYNHREGE